MKSTLLFLAAALSQAPAFGADPRLLWEIGKPDGANSEFALAPGGYRQFREDGFFVVGKSDPAFDWPYVHPGPVDGWAGGSAHTFSIVFGLKGAPPEGECRLKVALIDTHTGAPPRLTIRVNDQTFEQSLPGGAGDASVNGEPARGKAHGFEIPFPAKRLVAGDNRVQITTTGGSWLLYDWLALEGPPALATAPVTATTVVDVVQPMLALREDAGRMVQPVRVAVRHFGEPADAVVTMQGAPAARLRLVNGPAAIELSVPAVDAPTERTVVVEVGGRELARQKVTLKPVRRLTVYILPHSHTDIGYTEIQTAIEDKQVENLRKGMEYARRTASYPEGARFVWNVEVLWAADLFLRRRPEAERAAFFEAVRKGEVVLNGMYLNELTGLCRTEELIRLFRYATELGAKTGVPIDSAMISDVPGYTWGTVTAMAQAGVRYFSTAPNYFDRIGDILQKWENKPFWWLGPSGKERVLVWIPFKGYAMSHVYGSLTPAFVTEYQAHLEKTAYPYDIAYMRWSGHGDNAEPDPAICEFVKDWSARYAWPKFVISGTGEAFRAFEKRYGDRLPEVRGDWTPYWEDGAGSSALETSMNRWSSDRTIQAEALFAMLKPGAFPAAGFEQAWNNVLLYSEHTWGAWCSVSDPEIQATREQWEIKRSYALAADRDSQALLESALAAPALGVEGRVDVYNTTAWDRTELASVPASLTLPGDRVVDDRGRPVPSQRLRDGTLAFAAGTIPALAARRFTAQPGAGGATVDAAVVVASDTIENGRLRVRLDPTTGAIVEFTARGIEGNLVDTSGGQGLNDYLFLPGDKLADLKRNGPVRISIGERGPLVGSLVVESDAPGCRRLVREIRMSAGGDAVELIDLVDKERAATPTKPNDWQFAQKGGKESVNFAFPFNVPGGQLRLGLPVGVIRPDADLMPSACKNWFTVGRWADVSNRRQGVAWHTLDAPLVEVGDITATLIGSQANPDVWRKEVEPTQRFYSWAMNNHWGTNYRSYQEGPVVFRFILRPHGRFDPAANERDAIAASQPLLVRAAGAASPSGESRLRVEPEDVLVTGFKPSDDGRALIVRLYGASGRDRRARLQWADPAPTRMTLSDTSERAGEPLRGAVTVPGNGIVTVRAELPAMAVGSR